MTRSTTTIRVRRTTVIASITTMMERTTMIWMGCIIRAVLTIMGTLVALLPRHLLRLPQAKVL
jgi:hypothetical protein